MGSFLNCGPFFGNIGAGKISTGFLNYIYSFFFIFFDFFFFFFFGGGGGCVIVVYLYRDPKGIPLVIIPTPL